MLKGANMSTWMGAKRSASIDGAVVKRRGEIAGDPVRRALWRRSLN